MLPLPNPPSPIVKGIPSLGFGISFVLSPSKEQAPHSSADALAVIEDVEFIDELVHAVAGLCDGSQVGHQTHIIALLEQNKVKRVSGNHRETERRSYPLAK